MKAMWTPETIAKLQHAVRGNNAATYAEFSRIGQRAERNLLTLRGLF